VLGRRGAVTITIILGAASIPFSLYGQQMSTMVLGAFMLGFFGMGVWGMAPAYTSERFPTEVRGAGPGFCYHAGAAIGALMPWLLGRFQDEGVNLVTAMSVSMLVSGAFAIAAIWSGPETRGREFTA
jgi:MFS family permease